MLETSNYDGKIVIVLDEVLDKDFWIKSCTRNENVLFQSNKTGEFVPIDIPILYHLGLRTFEKIRLRVKDPDLTKYDKEIVECLDIAKALGTTEIYETILYGRLQLALLLNTRGGIGNLRKIFQGLVSHVDSKKGEISTYGKGLVASLGALLFMEGKPNKRLLTDTCTLFFHVSDACYGDDTFASMQIDADWEMLKRLIMGNTTPDERTAVGKLLEDAKNQQTHRDRRVRFSGKKAGNIGLAQNVTDIEVLQNNFDKQLGVDSECYRKSRIARFFKRKKQ